MCWCTSCTGNTSIFVISTAFIFDPCTSWNRSIFMIIIIPGVIGGDIIRFFCCPGFWLHLLKNHRNIITYPLKSSLTSDAFY